jgi:hypothetical protein
VERHVAVAERGESARCLRVEISIDHDDVGPALGRRSKPPQVIGELVPVDALHDQHGAFSIGKRAVEGLDEPEWILALEHSVEVEREQEQEAVREAEARA